MDNMTPDQAVETLTKLVEAQKHVRTLESTARESFREYVAAIRRAEDLAAELNFPALLEAVEGLVRENRQLREQLIGPQKQPASVRQIEAQAKSVANQLADAVQAQSRDLTSKPHGDESQKG